MSARRLLRTLTLLTLIFILGLFGFSAVGARLNPRLVYVPVTVVVRPTTTPLPGFNPTPLAPTPLPTLPSDYEPFSQADIRSTRVTIFEAGPAVWADFRVQLKRPPFDQAWHRLAWCVDLDQNVATGEVCGSNSGLGADWGFTLRIGPDAWESNNYALGGYWQAYNVCDYGSFDWNTFTLRLLFPARVLHDDGVFNYDVAILSAASEASPYSFNFGPSGQFSTSQVQSVPLPFDGIPLCALRG